MYTLAVRRSFSSRHFLTGGDWGPENDIHSHDYTVEVQLQAEGLDHHGYVVDILDVERTLGGVLERYADTTLNDLPEFEGENPSVERFCRILWSLLRERLNDPRLMWITVRLWETPDIWVAYTTGIPGA